LSSKTQKKYLEALKRYERKFDKSELYDYKMFVKRNKDDEDLDKLSLQKLENLYKKYHLNREKKDYEGIFKKPESEDNTSTD